MKTRVHPDALRWLYLNGRLVRARAARISVFDRSFQMGDGLYETMRMMNRQPIEWRAHWSRLAHSARQFGFKLPVTAGQCRRILMQLMNRCRCTEAIARIHVSRGIGPRGYSPRFAGPPTVVISLHPAPKLSPVVVQRVSVGLSTLVASAKYLLRSHKSASQLLHVLAKSEADAKGFDDMLLQDATRNILETTSSNFFWFNGRALITPPLSSGILPGITRQTVIRLARKQGINIREQRSPFDQVCKARGAFLTASTRGIVEIAAIGETPIPVHPLTSQIQRLLVHRWQRLAGIPVT